MRKLLFIITLLIGVESSYASHSYIGGEVGWECLSNGNYIFNLTLYFNCINPTNNGGLPFPQQNQLLNIYGSPLPRDINNNNITQINLKPDSTTWVNSGDISLQCDPTSLTRISCYGNSFIRGIQKITYTSDPIQLFGSLPIGGWEFRHEICCIEIYSNLNNTLNQILRAKMYSHNGNRCNDNSPKFTQNPDYNYYKNKPYKLNTGLMDLDKDSLISEFGFSYMGTANLPQINPYIPPFSISANSNVLAPAIFLNRFNGDMYFSDSSTSNRSILIVHKVSAYRNGQLLSVNYRESPLKFSTYVPSVMPVNYKPVISPPFYKGGTTYSFKDTITAGSLININLIVIDTNRINGNLQEIRVQVISDNIAKDYQFNGACTNPMDTNCAYISTANATFNAQRDGYEIRRIALYNGQIRWQTDCSDLSNSGGAKTHYFVVRAQDDLCPIPSVAYETIEITVLPPTSNPCPLVTKVESQVDLKNHLTVFPNPTHGQLTISSSINEELSLKIFNLQGQLVQEEILLNSSNQFNLKGEKGLYFIRITNQNGEQANLKIIKN